ncbi:hypothetical protein [Catellatospora sp. IY07-71]|uniref:hypothetical protein n=1 Tax=Catellatospora sp. IY07-71 TaxID=2728827 RepID=UPI001BB34C98|nr:hypothetical protein [Catellatospora sp. IY07-71]
MVASSRTATGAAPTDHRPTTEEPELTAVAADRPARVRPQTTLVFSSPDEPQPDLRDRAGRQPIAVNPFAVPADPGGRCSG